MFVKLYELDVFENSTNSVSTYHSSQLAVKNFFFCENLLWLGNVIERTRIGRHDTQHNGLNGDAQNKLHLE
jgi:hypothetical protein